MHYLWLLVLLFLAGCASQPKPQTDVFHDDPSRSTRQRILTVAENLLGVPYVPGGETPTEGMDCSGLVYYVYRQAGLQVPRTAAQQYAAGYHPQRTVMPADLLFFNTVKGRAASHVGIYAGNGQMIHVSSSSRQVRKVSLDLPYWQTHWLGSVSYLP
ncbi:MAG: C40 family peptidase [Candidatus Competibacteraceae bacterium]